MPLRRAGEVLERGDYRLHHLLLAVAVYWAGVGLILELISRWPWLWITGLAAFGWGVCVSLLLVKNWRRRRG